MSGRSSSFPFRGAYAPLAMDIIKESLVAKSPFRIEEVTRPGGRSLIYYQGMNRVGVIHFGTYQTSTFGKDAKGQDWAVAVAADCSSSGMCYDTYEPGKKKGQWFQTDNARNIAHQWLHNHINPPAPYNRANREEYHGRS